MATSPFTIFSFSSCLCGVSLKRLKKERQKREKNSQSEYLEAGKGVCVEGEEWVEILSQCRLGAGSERAESLRGLFADLFGGRKNTRKDIIEDLRQESTLRLEYGSVGSLKEG